MTLIRQQLWHRGWVVLLVLALGGVGLTAGVTSTRWIGTSFPGFFILANRVIASVSLPHWPIARRTELYQHVVVAVNGQPVGSAPEVYARVQELPPDSLVTYTLSKDGRTQQIALPSVSFGLQDYMFLFGAYLLNGLSVLLIGVSVWWVRPHLPASQALLALGGIAGGWALSAVDLYSPFWFFRLHVMGEALLPAGFIHLALVFPTDRFQPVRKACVWALYLLSGMLMLAYEWFVSQPALYSALHNLCMVYAGVGFVALLAGAGWDYWTTTSQLVRQRIQVIGTGFVAGLAFPAALAVGSGLTGGEVAVNYAAFTAFLFPLSLGYAIMKHDLFEIDALLKRTTYYLTLTVLLTLVYMLVVAVLNLTVSAWRVAASPFFPVGFTLSVLLLLNPLKDYLQYGIDRVFFRLRYNPKQILEETSAALVSTLQLSEIMSLIWNTIGKTVGVRRGGIFLRSPDSGQYLLCYPPPPSAETAFPLGSEHALVQAMRQTGRLQFVSEYTPRRDAGGVISSPPQAAQLAGPNGFPDMQLLVPLMSKDELIGVMALGKKESGRPFSVDDLAFLSTLTNQSALSIANAQSYQAIQELNIGLEKKVEQRTQALARANSELHHSLAQREHAYRELQRSQESLIRAEKMAAFGRMTAGMAHEMNTPLGSTLNTLDLLRELVEEYEMSIGDPQVTEQDHHEIAAEMKTFVGDTQQWITKATKYIRTLKLQARGLKGEVKQNFSLAQTIEDTRLLLAHQLRVMQCSLAVTGVSPDSVVYGDASKLSQVLTNLIGNAIDAYQDTDKQDRRVEVAVREAAGGWEIRVRDYGGGIAPESCGRIFDEFFSTKPFGKGTGLGLPIVRDIITSFFGGTVHVESVLGQGSTFIVWIPHAQADGGPSQHAQDNERPTSNSSLSPPDVHT